MKKFIAFLLAVAMVAFLVPVEDAGARGRGGGRRGGIAGSSRSRRSASRDKNRLKLLARDKIVDEDSLLRSRTKDRLTGR